MTEKLSKVINKFKEKSARLDAQTEALDREIKIIENEMEKLNDELVEMQLEGNSSGEEHHIKKKLKDLSIQLAEQEDLKASYKRVSEKGLVGDKGQREIKAIIDKEEIIRSTNLQKILNEKERTLQKIEELKNQEKVLSAQFDREHAGKERNIQMIQGMLKEIDPRAVHLAYDHKRSFIQHWLAGGDPDMFLKKPDTRNAREVINLGPKREVEVTPTIIQRPVPEVQKVASWVRS